MSEKKPLTRHIDEYEQYMNSGVLHLAAFRYIKDYSDPISSYAVSALIEDLCRSCLMTLELFILNGCGHLMCRRCILDRINAYNRDTVGNVDACHECKSHI